MDMEKIKRKNVKAGPKVNINIKVSADVFKWLKEKNYSPTGIFHEALKLIECPHVEGAQEPEETTEEAPSEDPAPAESTEGAQSQSEDASEAVSPN